MPAHAQMLKLPEAAVVAGVAIRDVNRVIDEQILPARFIALDDGRKIAPVACTLIDFYFSSARHLTASERMSAISVMAKRLDDVQAWPLAGLGERDWLVKDAFLTIDFAPFFKSVKSRMERLATARRSIGIDPEILSGTPVIRGTRIPAHDVAASVASGLSMERILAAYPGLTAEAVELATTYAEANPIRGRPRAPAPLPGAEVIADRRILRRRKAE